MFREDAGDAGDRACGPDRGREGMRDTGARRSPKIDVHCHMQERSVEELTRPHSVLAGMDVSAEAADRQSAVARANAASYSPALHVEMLDRLGLDAEVVSAAGVIQITSWADRETERRLHVTSNDEVARWVSDYPHRLVGACTLPLQDERLALAELARCTSEGGFPVVSLPVAVNGTYLSDPSYWYLWEAIEDQSLLVLAHPDGVLDPWFRKYSMWNSVGQPIEEAKFMASLIYEGVLERFPKLKLIVAHGGGYLPHYFGRLDRNVVAWPQSTKNLSKKPSEYLRDFYYDTCLYEPAMLAALVQRVGHDRIVMGSDFPAGDPDPVGFVERCELLSGDEASDITGGTAARLLGCVADGDRLGIITTVR
jgi:aminocarboxymuconate-semialdehyde decarboxylase